MNGSTQEPNGFRMLFAANCALHGGYPGDALARPKLGDLAICMQCGELGIFKLGFDPSGIEYGHGFCHTRVGNARLMPEPIKLDQISPPLDGNQNFMLVQILDAIRNRRAARATSSPA